MNDFVNPIFATEIVFRLLKMPQIEPVNLKLPLTVLFYFLDMADKTEK